MPKKKGPVDDEDASLEAMAACAATASASTRSLTEEASPPEDPEPKNLAETDFRVERGISAESGKGSPAPYSFFVNSSKAEGSHQAEKAEAGSSAAAARARHAAASAASALESLASRSKASSAERAWAMIREAASVGAAPAAPAGASMSSPRCSRAGQVPGERGFWWEGGGVAESRS